MNPDSPSRRLFHLACLFVQYAMPWLLAIALVVVIRDTALAMTGSDSILRAWVELVSNIRVSRGFAFVFGGACTLYGLHQRKLRRLDRKRLLDRIAVLEQRLLQPPAGQEPR